MKILNIDAFASTKRQITIGEVTHDVQEPTVQQFIDNLKAAEALEGDGATPSMRQSFEQAVVAICQAMPTMKEEQVRALKLPAMTAVLQFIRGELDPDVANTASEGDAGAEKKSS